MLQPPRVVADYLVAQNLAHRSPAYLLIDREENLISWGGELAVYGLNGLKQGENAREQLLFLEGLLPLQEGPIFLSCVRMPDSISADIHLVPDNDGDWVLLLDATEEEEQRRFVQQKVNDASLERTSQAQEVERLERLRLSLQPDAFGIALLSRLDIVALERVGPHHLRVISSAPEWFTQTFARVLNEWGDLLSADEFPFLDNFLVDAEEFWAKQGRDSLRSGIWSESDGSGAEHYLEATVVCVQTQSLLLIERLGTEFREKEALIQRARDRALHIEARQRAEALLQKAHEELEERVVERTAELVASNRSLQEQMEQRQRAEERVNYLAFHDALTGLPNRTLFEDRLRHALAPTLRLNQMLAVLFVSIDRFKVINDTLGYQAGDFILQKVTERLRNCLRVSDTVARFGGDEFALIVTHIDLSKDAVKLAATLHQALQPVFTWENHELHVSASIGVSLFPADGDDAPTLMRNAAAALHRAKINGGNGYQFYHHEIDVAARKRFALEGNLRRAIEREEFVVHYQPRVDVKSNRVIGMEALARWQHPERGLIFPGEFISLAEETGLIASIGEQVLRQACLDTKRWNDNGSNLRVSVNLSARQFEQPGLVATIMQILQETGLEHQHLDLEITESLVMRDPAAAITLLNQLKSVGIAISMDDFGSGYSNLSYLKRFPIDVLKLDRSFVQDATNDPADAAIVMTIIALAHNLNLRTVAEGVETQEQLHFLRLLRCDEVQGHVFSSPLSAPEFEKFVEEKNAL